MQQPHGIRAFRFVLVIALLSAIAACSRDSPEQAVRRQIEAMQSAIEERDAGALSGVLAVDFIGHGGMDRREARGLAVAVFLRHRQVDARLGPIEVLLRGQGEAVARFSVLVTGGNGGLLPESGQVYRVETGWRFAGGECRLVYADWTAVS